MTLESRTHGVARAFLAGGLAAFACALALPSVIYAAQGALPLPRAVAAALRELPNPLSLAVGGLLAGRALDAGRRGTAAVGLAMLVAGAIQGFVAIDAGGLTGREDPVLAVALVASTGVAAFTIGGASAGALMSLRARQVWRLVQGFAAAGLLASVPVVAAFFLARVGAGTVLGSAFPLVLLLLQAAGILVPFFVAGIVLARVLEDESNS